MRVRLLIALFGIAAAAVLSRAEPEAPKGQRVFSAGHSFHMFVPQILGELAKSAGIKDHVQVGSQGIGGSRVIQHWDYPDEKNKVKPALREGKVDVLTLSPIYHPDEGIDHFVKLALEHNPNVRVTTQAFWLPYDVYAPDYQKKRPEKVDRNSRTVEQMREAHSKYFEGIDAQVKAINERHGKSVVSVVPVGQAVILLRAKIIEGKAPGLKQQEELFADAIGHVHAPVKALTAYCHFAVIYKRSPVGLPAPTVLKGVDDKLNTLLQELAWEAVTSHPLSGVKTEAKR